MVSGTLHGRDAALGEAATAQRGVVVLAGDSGIGKSAMLAELIDGWPGDPLVAESRVLASIRGSLQTAVADALADALHQYSSEHPDSAAQVWARLRDVGQRVANAGLKQIGDLLLARMFTAIESKLGAEVSQVIRAGLSEILRPASDGIDGRLQQLVVPDVVDQIITIAEEINAITGTRVVVRLDGGERLAEDDLGLLAEFADRGSEAVLLVVTWNSAYPGAAAALTRVQSRGGMRLELEALTRAALDAWLVEEGVPSSQWDLIATLTSGYPLFVVDAIRLSKLGVDLGELSVSPDFTALLEAAWHSLTPALQAAALRLSGFVDPPPDAFVTEFLGLDNVQWDVLRNQLVEANVFIRRPDGVQWFHERRRSFYWDRYLSPASRKDIAEGAMQAITTWIDRVGIESWLTIPAASLSRAAESDLAPNGFLRKLAQAGPDELSLLCALLECIEGESATFGQFAETGEVARHAARRFGRPADPVAALERLIELGLAFSSANETLSISTYIVPPGGLALAALVGAIEEALHVTPVPRMASQAFDFFLRPLLGAFPTATISLEPDSLRLHRQNLERLRSESGAQFGSIPPALGVGLIVDGQAVTATVLYDSLEGRDAAQSRIEAVDWSRGRASLAGTVRLPPARIRYGRYEAIAKTLAPYRQPATMASGPDLVEWAHRRLRVLEVLRTHMDLGMASAFGLNGPPGLVIDAESAPHDWAEFQLRGGSEVALREASFATLGLSATDPLLELKLRRAGLVREGERIVRSTFHMLSRPDLADPLVNLVETLTELGRAFNRGLSVERLPLDEAVLSEMVSVERGVQRAVVDALVQEGLVDPAAQDRYSDSVYIALYSEQGPWDGVMWMGYALEVRDGRGEAIVRILQADDDIPRAGLADGEEWGRVLGVPPLDLIGNWGSGAAQWVLDDYLGYTHEDFRLPWPGESLGE